MKKLLENAKVRLGITVNDELINKDITLKVNATKGYLENGGAKIDINSMSGKTLSCIAIGVSDLLNDKAGRTKFSPAFSMPAM